MRDVRLLTLYKQHYLDDYKNPLKCQYTCWGYYDGIDIDKVENSTYSSLFEKRSQAPISELWYSTGKKIEKMNGGYSNQNIGIFRCVSDEKRCGKAAKFWEEMDSMPFIAIGLIKLVDRSDYDKVSLHIEEYVDEDEEKLCRALAYCTYDNADLVVLLQGNNIPKIESILRKIEGMEEISYLHSIMGASEKYLQCCADAGTMLDKWEGQECFLEEDVNKVNIHLVTCGDSKIISGLKYELDKWNAKWEIKEYGNISYSYIVGHGNINIIINKTNVKSLLILLLPGGFATHQNPLYGKGLYNIETEVSLKEEKWNDIEANELQGTNTTGNKGWCRKLIEKYRNLLSNALEQGDDSLYSYLQAMVQTLNTLDQYENFAMSQDIFFLLYPAFDMFDQKFDAALQEWRDRKDMTKEALCNLLVYASSVIYHTIHTDQVFLMIPGYSGTSFSIPIKLSLLYLWFIDKVAKVINDKSYQYRCILTPEMESRPITGLINLGLEESDRLICVRLSQRSLFLPRDLMIILSHEIGHYIGSDLRKRASRLDCLVRTLGYFVTEGIAPGEFDGFTITESERNIWVAFQHYLKKELPVDVAKVLGKKMKEKCPGKEFYADDVETALINSILEIVMDDGGVVYKVIYDIPSDVLSQIPQDEKYVDNMRYLYKIQRHLERNKKILAATGIVEKIVRVLVKVYREIFSDMVALAVLDCSETDYHEAFQVSEGAKINEENKTPEQVLRETVAKAVVFSRDRQVTEDTEDENPGQGRKDRDLGSDYYGSTEKILMNNLYNYVWVENYLEIYARKCYEAINTYICEASRLPDVKKIRELFDIFKTGEANCYEIYNMINGCICEYADEVKGIYGDKRCE